MITHYYYVLLQIETHYQHHHRHYCVGGQKPQQIIANYITYTYIVFDELKFILHSTRPRGLIESQLSNNINNVSLNEERQITVKE